MVTLPNFTVAVPSDEHCGEALVKDAAKIDGPVYIRTGRPAAPLVHSKDTEFKLGKAVRIREGKDVSLIANGLLVHEALVAADKLAADGIEASVIDFHTIKPLDEAMLLEEAKKTGAVVVAEEHQIWGGLGAHVAQFLGKECPVPMGYVAIEDVYAESGTPDDLLKKYGMTAENIESTARKVVQRKA